MPGRAARQVFRRPGRSTPQEDSGASRHQSPQPSRQTSLRRFDRPVEIRGRIIRRSSTCRSRRKQGARSAGRPPARESPRLARFHESLRSAPASSSNGLSNLRPATRVSLPAPRASGVYLAARLGHAVAAPLDEGAAGIAVANQPFDAWHAELIGHRVGRRLAGVGHRHDDACRRRGTSSKRASSSPRVFRDR